jgi:hypothetical protein
MREDHQAELDRHFAWFEGRLPPRPARLVGWLRKPSSRYAGIPLAILLIVGGVFSFLPVLGLWMLPRTPFVRAGRAGAAAADGRMLGWVERKWIARQRAKGAR